MLKGSAHEDDFAEEERVAFVAALREKIKERVTLNEMERIVRDVKESEAGEGAPRLSPEHGEERAAFVAANLSSAEAYFYEPEGFAGLKKIFEEHLEAAPAAEEGEGGENGAEGSEEEAPAPAEGEEVEGEEGAAEAPGGASQWDGSVAVILEAIEAGRLSPGSDLTADAIRGEVDAILTKMKIPSNEGMIAYNAIYALVGSVADTIEEHLFQEAPADEAAEAGDEGEGGEGGEEGDSGDAEPAPAEPEGGDADAGAAEGEGEDKPEGEEGAEEGEAEAEPAASEAHLAALEGAASVLAGVDAALGGACASLGAEFEKQFLALKQREREATSAEQKEHLLWESFHLSRAKEQMIG